LYNYQHTIRQLKRILPTKQPIIQASPDLRPSAVAILLLDQGGEAHLVMTRRADTLRLYPGRLTFPGGSYEATDASLEAAMKREVFEEIGVSSVDIEVIGRLDDRIAKQYCMTPFVAELLRYQCRIDTNEVAEVRAVPLSTLAHREEDPTLSSLITPQTNLMIEQLFSLLASE
jgi:8-oxo-dGTP pyrophosphatase MutT (NUDIX family)